MPLSGFLSPAKRGNRRGLQKDLKKLSRVSTKSMSRLRAYAAKWIYFSILNQTSVFSHIS